MRWRTCASRAAFRCRRLQIIETPALNAYASGLREGHYVVAVTRGLMDTLAPDELEAVLAHELTHIRNRDAQLMVIAVIFAGVFAFFGDWSSACGTFPTAGRRRPRASARPCGGSPAAATATAGSAAGAAATAGGGAILVIAIAIAVILITWGISTLIRFALSRSREFLADAGSAELTKNPDAMVRALRKIEGHARFNVPSRMEAFFIENPVSGRLTGLLSTHPSDRRPRGGAAALRRGGSVGRIRRSRNPPFAPVIGGLRLTPNPPYLPMRRNVADNHAHADRSPVAEHGQRR